MRQLLLLGTLLCAAKALPTKLTGQALVDYINEKGLYEAVYNPDALETISLGLLPDRNQKLWRASSSPSDDIPDEFDVATNYPECADIVNNIRDQSNCGSCWAVSAAGAISDRICVVTNGSVKVSISSYQAAACANGDGCQGGMLDSAFYIFVEQGLPTGSEIDKGEGCRPYPFKHCAHHTNSTIYPNCSSLEDYHADKCYDTCQSGYDKEYHKDLYYGAEVIGFDYREDAQRSIMVNGSIIAGFDVYESFLHYKSGIYQHVEGEEYQGSHAVRVVGWGVEDGQKYWRIANSWNQEWGDHGFFKLTWEECGYGAAVNVDTSRLPNY